MDVIFSVYLEHFLKFVFIALLYCSSRIHDVCCWFLLLMLLLLLLLLLLSVAAVVVVVADVVCSCCCVVVVVVVADVVRLSVVLLLLFPHHRDLRNLRFGLLPFSELSSTISPISCYNYSFSMLFLYFPMFLNHAVLKYVLFFPNFPFSVRSEFG